ncbi:hypothetical protein PS1_025876 [Malus domestica]
MEEAHSGVCGAHQSGPKLHFQLKRMGYYWPSMVKDCLEYAKRCQACQFHANFIHQPPEPLHPTAASWPFDAWGLDVVGPITPKSSAGNAYFLAATNYFSKWAEAIPLREVKKETVVRFIKEHIIHRYGVPRYIITDNGKQFSNRLVDELCEKYKFKQHKSSMYHAPANGLAEAFNKTLCNLLKKVIGRTKRDWHERISEALWAYRTTHRTPTQATPYSLVYGVEAVLPLESQIPSLRMAIQEGLTEKENAKLRLQELEALDERRLEAQQHLECYQARLSKAFNKKVRPRSFQTGDLVLALRVESPVLYSTRLDLWSWLTHKKPANSPKPNTVFSSSSSSSSSCSQSAASTFTDNQTKVKQISWEPRVFVYEGLLTNAECDHLISIAKSELKRSAVVGNLFGQSKFIEVRTNSGRFVPKVKDPVDADKDLKRMKTNFEELCDEDKILVFFKKLLSEWNQELGEKCRIQEHDF